MEMEGISVKGKNHEHNQDSFLILEEKGTMVIAVSDGLGSMLKSGEGSAALCDILKTMIEADILPLNDMEETARMLHFGWMELLKKRNVSVFEAFTTCLFCVVDYNQAYIFRLGDGFIGIKADGMTRVFFDDKKDGMLNETYCLQDQFDPREWEMSCWQYDELEGVVICTDGVDIACEGISQEDGLRFFMEDFLHAYGNSPVKDSREEIKAWLEEWKSCDDKTLVYLIKGADGDGKRK